jgi:type I restriction enzyme R subunit
MFMRAVKSRNFFEQMKGRGVRIIAPTDLQAVTPDAKVKDHFVIVDCVGVCEQDKTDSAPMDQKKSVPFDKLLQAVALGNVEPEVLSSVAARLARLNRELTEGDKQRVMQAAGGASLQDLTRAIVDALDPDVEDVIAAKAAIQAAVRPFASPELRNLLIDLKRKAEQIIDTVTQDTLLQADFSEAARERAKGTVESFEKFIAEHKDEITALQILYSRPQRMSGAAKGQGAEPLTFEALKALADALQAPPHLWTESQLWQAYAALDKTKVKGESRRRILTDLVSLVRYAMHQDNELLPFPERVNANFTAWLAQSTQTYNTTTSRHSGTPTRHSGESRNPGIPFTPEQMHWLEMIRDHIAANLGIVPDDFEYSPFTQEGGIGKVHQLFGAELPKVLEALNLELAA